MTARTSTTARRAGQGTLVAGAVGAMNVATYGYTMVAARWLGPHGYGAFAALMGLLLVLGVVQLGLQATAARRIAAAPDHVGQIERSVLRVTYRAAVGLGVVCLLVAPLVDHVLRLGGPSAAVLVAVAVVPMTVFGAQAGVLQGERRWAELAVLYLANGLPRLLVGSALVLWRPSEVTAMLGVVLGQVVPVLIGWWVLRRRTSGADAELAGRQAQSGRRVFVEVAHNSHVLLAYFALSNVDVLVARSVLPDHQAGLYAAGVIVVKAVLFLPQFVVVLAFPSMSSGTARRRVLAASLGAVLALGAVACGAAALLPDLALVFVGGHQYDAIAGDLWRFAALGTVLAMLQLLVYGVLADQARAAVYAIWAALIAVVALGRASADNQDLLQRVSLVDAALLVALAVIGWSRLRRTGPG